MVVTTNPRNLPLDIPRKDFVVYIFNWCVRIMSISSYVKKVISLVVAFDNEVVDIAFYSLLIIVHLCII